MSETLTTIIASMAAGSVLTVLVMVVFDLLCTCKGTKKCERVIQMDKPKK